MKGNANDFARMTSDNVDPGGPMDGQLGKDLQDFARIDLCRMLILGGQWMVNLECDLQRLCKDYL